MILTKAQRVALKKVYDRTDEHNQRDWNEPTVSYLEFRRTVQPEIGSFGCIMVPWCGMWLGIEKDGHTHS